MGQAPTVRVLNDVDEAICSALLVVNCLYVASDYRAAGIAVNILINSYVGFERSLNIFANIAKE